jgi:hypothetical protein
MRRWNLCATEKRAREFKVESRSRRQRVIVLAGQQFEDLKGYLQETDLKTKAKGGEGVSTPYFAS